MHIAFLSRVSDTKLGLYTVQNTACKTYSPILPKINKKKSKQIILFPYSRFYFQLMNRMKMNSTTGNLKNKPFRLSSSTKNIIYHRIVRLSDAAMHFPYENTFPLDFISEN